MVQIQKNLKVKCVATGEYFPKNITKGEWYNVIGIISREYKAKKNDKDEIRTMIKFLVINDKMKLQRITADNCEVIDTNEELAEGKKDNKK